MLENYSSMFLTRNHHYKACKPLFNTPKWSNELDGGCERLIINETRSLPHNSGLIYYRVYNNPVTDHLNITRLEVLTEQFPDGTILLPFRQPLQHAASLLCQHKNFLKIHSQDRFARDYMAAIGHYDFGENLRPIDFNNWLEHGKSLDPKTHLFWIEYWIAGYSHILCKPNKRIHLLSFEALCESPHESLERIADAIEIKDRDTFVEQAVSLRTPKPHPIDSNEIPETTLENAIDLYDKLSSQSLI